MARVFFNSWTIYFGTFPFPPSIKPMQYVSGPIRQCLRRSGQRVSKRSQMSTAHGLCPVVPGYCAVGRRRRGTGLPGRADSEPGRPVSVIHRDSKYADYMQKKNAQICEKCAEYMQNSIYKKCTSLFMPTLLTRMHRGCGPGCGRLSLTRTRNLSLGRARRSLRLTAS